jgi:AraC family transcriptional regulator, regulatory protein of adaptative response / methylated-DNA-[protein]-cysteine methyltransferase
MNDYQRIAKAIEFISEHFKEQPKLEAVADAVHLSPFHFQRMFTSWAGISPKKFQQFLSLNLSKELMKTGDVSLSEVAYEAGFSGSSRLHDLFVTIEAMTPGAYKSKGNSLNINYSFHESPFGGLIVASTDLGICKLEFVSSLEEGRVLLQAEWPEAILTENAHANQATVNQIFGVGEASQQPIQLNLKGTPFQVKVWEALLRIPEGQLSTYQQIADYIGHPKASRAVGSAIGSNPVAVLIPCHRVIRRDGGIGGYHWGNDRKLSLIAWEKVRTMEEEEMHAA